MDISAGSGSDMRYHPESSAPHLSIDSPQPPQLLNLYSSAGLNPTLPYTHDTTAYYHPPQPHTNTFGVGQPDFRSRLSSKCVRATHFEENASLLSSGMPPKIEHQHIATNTNRGGPSSAPLTGMASSHTLRNTTLPLPNQHHISAREQYAAAIPSFRRPSEHQIRSPNFPGPNLRRIPLSPPPNPIPSFGLPTSKMEAGQFNPGANRGCSAQVPPLSPTQALGSLTYADGTDSPVKVEISGSIDKGFFLSDGEWTCYRRNYFACICSYSLSPHYPGVPLQFASDSNQPAMQVFGFAMCLSAVVADNDQQGIELVQHTPKRDKGPIAKPEKVVLNPKQSMGGNHSLALYSDLHGAGTSSQRLYNDSFSGSQSSCQGPPNEHTFERIQFKQATQNNGKRRAAQQYYHLVLELWADTGNSRSGQYTKVAVRKSAKMIVRGRSPGHYQSDRRGSQSSGPGGSSGNLGSYHGMSSISDYASGSLMGGGGSAYASGVDPRGSIYGIRHQHDLPSETSVPSDDEKTMEMTKSYQYYPASIYNGHSDRVDMFPHRTESDNGVSSISTGGTDVIHKGGCEPESRYFPQLPLPVGGRRCGPFEGKSSSSGYYPTLLSPSGMNITMT